MSEDLQKLKRIIEDADFNEKKIKQIKDGYTALFKRSYDFNLTINELELLSRQIIQSIDIYNYAIDNDNPDFLAKHNALLNEATRHLTPALVRVNERIERLKNHADRQTLPAIKNDTKDEVFKLLFANKFPAIEQRLYDAGYIDLSRKWLKTANELVSLLLAIMDKMNFKSTIKAKQKKDFFQSRYKKNITQNFEPANRKNAKTFKPYFESLVNNTN